jgi:hypothetical protein
MIAPALLLDGSAAIGAWVDLEELLCLLVVDVHGFLATLIGMLGVAAIEADCLSTLTDQLRWRFTPDHVVLAVLLVYIWNIYTNRGHHLTLGS